ncbi:MAG TPA: antitoxin [Friedmanniella sp.]
MGIFDKARDALPEHADRVDRSEPVDRLADQADQRTGSTHHATSDPGADLGADRLGDQARRDTAIEPGRPG